MQLKKKINHTIYDQNKSRKLLVNYIISHYTRRKYIFYIYKSKKKLNKSLQYRRFNPLGIKQSLISVEFKTNTRRYYHTVFPIKEQSMLLRRYKERNNGKLLFVTLVTVKKERWLH